MGGTVRDPDEEGRHKLLLHSVWVQIRSREVGMHGQTPELSRAEQPKC